MNELKKELKEYNFLEKSVRSFSREYNICEKTVLKYLRLNGISYRRKGVMTCIPRDRLGRFTLKMREIRVFSHDDNINDNNRKDKKEEPKLDIFKKLAKKCKAK